MHENAEYAAALRREMRDRLAADLRKKLIAVLDIGSSKVCCFIARVEPTRAIDRASGVDDPERARFAARVIGVGHQRSRGIRAGAIVDMEAATQAVCQAVDAAERMADVTIDSVVVSCGGGRPRSRLMQARANVPSGRVTPNDVRRAHMRALSNHSDPRRVVLHALPVVHSLGGREAIFDPVGMAADHIVSELAVVTVDDAHLRNLVTCVESAHLHPAGVVAAPIASALGVLQADERNLGVTLVDLGGGTTSVISMMRDRIIFCDVVRIGGSHITKDIADGLSTPFAHAERIKTLFGSALPGASDHRRMIDIPPIGEDDGGGAHQAPQSVLTGVVRPRLEETLLLARERMERADATGLAGRRLVLTGGASQLTGAAHVAERIFSRQHARLGRPIRVSGLADAMTGTAFATAAGLVAYAADGPEEAYESVPVGWRFGRFGGLGRWFRGAP